MTVHNPEPRNGLTFTSWLDAADKHVMVLAGVGLSDLADGMSYDSWADGVAPQEYAEDMLAEEGFPFEDEDPTAGLLYEAFWK